MKKIYLLFTLTLFLFLTGCDFGGSKVTGLSIDLPNKLEYVLGESFDNEGINVTAYFDNGDYKLLTSDDYKLTGTNLNRLGLHTISVNYKGVIYDFSVYVKEDPTKIVLAYITDYPSTVFYDTKPEDKDVILEGLSITYMTTDHDTKNASVSDFSIEVIDLQLMDNNYKVYVVNLSHNTLEGIATGFLIYVKA